MLIDIENQTIQVRPMNPKKKPMTLSVSVIKQMEWMISSDGKLVVMVIDSSKAIIDSDSITINDGDRCRGYSAEFIGAMYRRKIE